jgi:hypothetical protein
MAEAMIKVMIEATRASGVIVDPMGTAGVRNWFVAPPVVHVPDEAFLRRDVLVHFLDGIFFRLSGHGFLRRWG